MVLFLGGARILPARNKPCHTLLMLIAGATPKELNALTKPRKMSRWLRQRRRPSRSTSSGSGFAVTKLPSTNSRFAATDRDNSIQRRSRNARRRRRGVAVPNRKVISASVARYNPSGRYGPRPSPLTTDPLKTCRQRPLRSPSPKIRQSKRSNNQRPPSCSSVRRTAATSEPKTKIG